MNETWSKRLGIVCVLWMLHPLAAEAAYRCRVTVRRQVVRRWLTRKSRSTPWLPWQTPEGMARNQGLRSRCAKPANGSGD